ncbi:MAG: leucine-rich repeat protein [Clostridia bacterium]|nr:leucine-rich repeat protein [Clostridia bacterium]
MKKKFVTIILAAAMLTASVSVAVTAHASDTVPYESGRRHSSVYNRDIGKENWRSTAANKFYYEILDNGTAFITSYGHGLIDEVPEIPTEIDGIPVSGHFTDFQYDVLDDGTIALVKYAKENKSVENVVVPSQINGRPVTKIELSCFADNSDVKTPYGLKTITLPNTLTEIVANAFTQCPNLTKIEIPDSVEKIDRRAFNGLSALESVKLPKNLSSLGEYAFCDCKALKSIELPGTITEMGNGCFEGCEALEKVTIGNGISEIPYSAFAYCSSLKSITIPSSVKTIGASAFLCDTSLSNVVISGGVETIGYNAFRKCTSLSSVTIPNTVTEIDYDAFYETPWLRDYSSDFVVVGDGVLVAFQGEKPDSPSYTVDGTDHYVVTIPSTVKSISTTAFASDIGSSHSEEDRDNELQYYKDLSWITDIVIPSTVTRLDSQCFTLYSTTNYTIPDSVEFIGYNALDNSYSVNKSDGDFLIEGDGILVEYRGNDENVVIPDSVKVIGFGAFKNNENIKSVTIPDSVTVIASEAFYECRSLESVTIGNGVKAIGNRAFQEDRNLKTVKTGNSLEYIGVSAFYKCTALESISTPSTFKGMGSRAFQQCLSLKQADLAGTINTIPDSAFGLCKSLEKVTIPDTVKKIGSYAFYGCKTLGNVKLPTDIRSLGSYALYGCESIQDMSIPSSLHYIDSSALLGLPQIENNKNTFVVVGDGVLINVKTDDEDIIIPDNVKYISPYVFVSRKYNPVPDSAYENGYVGDVPNKPPRSTITLPESMGTICPAVLYSSTVVVPNRNIRYIDDQDMYYGVSGLPEPYQPDGIIGEYMEGKTALATGYASGSITLTLKGYKGSTTEKFVKEHSGYIFEAIDGDSKPGTDTTSKPGTGTTSNPSSKTVLGDIDGDGVITSADALGVLRGSIGLVPSGSGLPAASGAAATWESGISTADFYIIGDVDKDGNITSADALALLRYSVGMTSLESIGKPIN